MRLLKEGAQQRLARRARASGASSRSAARAAPCGGAQRSRLDHRRPDSATQRCRDAKSRRGDADKVRLRRACLAVLPVPVPAVSGVI
jgi:hypothetical protein